MKRARFAVVGCVLGVLASLAGADGLIVVESPGADILPQPGHHRFAPLRVEHHHVEVAIHGQVATTRVDQTFFNPTGNRLEGTYLFPIPEGAHIDKFSMDVDGQMLEAEMLDAAKAREIYLDIVRRMKDPALLEYAGHGAIKARIFPIEPNSQKRIILTYTQLLTADNGVIRYQYPLNTEKFSAGAIESVSVRCTIESEEALGNIYSPSHDIDVKRANDRHATAGFELRDARPDTDFVLYVARKPNRDTGVDLRVLSYREPTGGAGTDADGYFLLLANPSASQVEKKPVPRDVVFVLDTSGSMAGGKLEQAREALKYCINSLNDGDHFQIVRFSSESETLFDSLEDATAENRQAAIALVQKVQAAGGTDLDSAVRDALSAVKGQDAGRSSLIILLTDGQPTVGQTKPDAIVDGAKGLLGERGPRLFAFGVGSDVNTQLLDCLTGMTRAFSRYVLPRESIEQAVSDFYGKISHPVLTELRVQFGEGARARLLEPSDLPDLYLGGQLVLLGRYSGAGPTTVTVSGQGDGEPRTIAAETVLAEGRTPHEFIPQLWATRHVATLLDEIRLNGESEELKQEVARLARRWGIVTPYTSYLIVEDERRRDVPAGLRTLQSIDRSEVNVADAQRAFDEWRTGTTGADAVAPAAANVVLKQSASVAGLGAANQTAAEAAGARGAGQMAMRAQSANRIRTVAGRTFYQNGSQWIDAEAQVHAGAEAVRLQVGSPEHLARLAAHPEAGPWLAVGSNVQLWLGGRLYDIVE